MEKEERERRHKIYVEYKEKKKMLRGIPNDYDKDDTLELLGKMYLYLKKYHNDLPKLTKTRLRCRLKSENFPNDAMCDENKRIQFKPTILTKRFTVTNILGDDNWNLHQGNFMLGELLTHEIAHFRINGKHNKRFYARQRQLFSTFINGMISGELYQFNG